MALCCLAAPLCAAAHHSSAFYGYSTDITELTGELKDVAWANPHVAFTLIVRDSSGKEAVWDLELPGSVYSHERRGIVPSLFKAGDKLTVAGNVAGRVERRFLVTNIRLVDDREIVVRERVGRRWAGPLFDEALDGSAEAVARAAKEGKRLFRVWSQPREGDAEEIGELPFRQEAIAARNAWNPLDNFVTRCETPGMPDVMDSPYPIEFVDHGEWIELRAIGNYNLATRTIRFENAPPPADPSSSPLGYSRATWEGDTLIVRTTEIDWPYFDNRGTPQSPNIEILERFALSADQSRLEYEMTVTDNTVFAQPGVVTKRESYAALGEAMPTVLGCNR
jgi:hypothetical protein